MTQQIISQSYWDERYRSLDFKMALENDHVRTWIERYISRGAGTCFEIGCYPGRYLSVFGELGYELHGIDLADGVEDRLPGWFKSRGYRTGRFNRVDIKNFRTAKKYDIVCSFGFLEHFSNWEEILARHAEMVKENGLLVISTPNFRGLIQRFLHVFLDNANRKRHNPMAMKPFQWAQIVKKLGFNRAIFCGYFNSFFFWEDRQPRNVLQRIMIRAILAITKTLDGLLPEGKLAYSPFCGLICRRGT